MSKILLINGSPNEKGCTYTALCEIADTLAQNGVDPELLYLGKKPVAGCIDCGKCFQTGRCVFDDKVNEVLEKLDEFDLNDYIRAVRFDQLKVPTVPFQLPSFKVHYGLENIRQALLDFLRSTALSRSRDPVFMCSDMPMEELARDMDFSKKWMLPGSMNTYSPDLTTSDLPLSV